jgi:hypothetical protein
MRRLEGSTARTGALAAALAAVLLAAGCGSTLPLATQRAMNGQSAAGTANGGLGGPGSASGPAGASSPAGTAGPAGSVGSGSGSRSPVASGAGTAASNGGSGGYGTSSAPGPASGSGAAGGGATAASGPGVTPNTIYIGLQYDPSAQAEDSALGAGGLNPGDVQAENNAMVAYINSHGGVAGRKLSIVWASVNSNGNLQQQEQAACNTWTVDHKVFVIPSGVPIWDQCTANAHAIGVSSGDIAQETTPMMRQFPADFNLSGMTLDRAGRYTIAGLARQGYFAAGAKVGIVTWDGPDFRYAAGAAVSELAGMGRPGVPVEYVSEPQSYGDLASSSSDVSSAILKFRSEGINHVLLFDGTAGVFSGAGLTILFMNAAGSQGYHPEYGLNSTSGLSTVVPDVPASEIANSMGVGWIPSLDLDSADYAALPQSANAKTCLHVMSAAGQSATTANAQAVAYTVCDFYFFLQDALDRVSGPLDQASAVAAIQGLGSSFPVISTFQDDFTTAQHDGVELVRDATYENSCSCFRYSSPPYNPG